MAEYQFPHEIKGTIHYFTALQDQIHAIAKPLMIGTWAFLFAMIGIGLLIDRRSKEKSIRRALERDVDMDDPR